MLSHGLTTGALFLLVGMLYDRRHTYELTEFRGLWKAVPVFGGLFVAATFASIGLPGFSGFVGEFLSLLGAFLTSRWYAVVADHRRDPRRGVPVVGRAAGVHRRARREERGDPRHRLPRDLHGGAAARPVAVPRLLPEAGARPAPAERRRARHPGRHAQQPPDAGGQLRVRECVADSSGTTRLRSTASGAGGTDHAIIPACSAVRPSEAGK